MSESEDDEEPGASSPSKTTPLSRLTPPSRPGSAQKAAVPAPPEAAGFGELAEPFIDQLHSGSVCDSKEGIYDRMPHKT